MSDEFEDIDSRRPVYLHICKDGTLSYRRRHQKNFNNRTLPFFTVDNEKQAHEIQVRFCRFMPEGHPDLPSANWYVWTDFPGTVEAIDEVAAKVREFYLTHLAPKLGPAPRAMPRRGVAKQRTVGQRKAS